GHERDRLAADAEGDRVRRMRMRDRARRGPGRIHGGVHQGLLGGDVPLRPGDLVAREIDGHEVLGLRVAQGHAARRDEEGVARSDARRDVAARGRHQAAVPGAPAEAGDVFAQAPLLRARHRHAGRRHQAALPYAAARPRSGEPRVPRATSAATRIASSRFLWSARFLPAMSKAVPWPVDVRMSGIPMSSVTTRPKPTSLTAMSPWSW